MIKPIKDNRRKNAIKNMPKPCWAEAFLILLLYENAILRQRISGEPKIAQKTVPLANLRKFEALKCDNKTKLTFDKVAGTVTITAPEAVIPEEPKIIHNDGIVDIN